jgi:monoamine oxidase
MEADSRLGGRIFTKQFPDGSYVEFGGSYIGPTQYNMYRLVDRYNLQL